MAHHDGSSSILPLLLIGGAAFLAWQYFSSQTSAPAPVTGTPTVPVGTSPTAANITTLPMQVVQQVSTPTQGTPYNPNYYVPVVGGGQINSGVPVNRIPLAADTNPQQASSHVVLES